MWLKRDVVEARGKVCSELWIECTSKPLDAVLLVVTFIDEATGDVTGQVVKMERDRAELN
ncbi:MAG TPA: hypothetical protein VF420_13320 [Casimicrobiaceae bacterium]